MKNWRKKNRVHRYTEKYSVTNFYQKYVKLNRKLGIMVDNVDYCTHEGDISDYSSVPRIFDFVIEPTKVNVAGLIHDKAKYG